MRRVLLSCRVVPATTLRSASVARGEGRGGREVISGTFTLLLRVQRVGSSCLLEGLLAMCAENFYRQWVFTHCPNGATVQMHAARGTSTSMARWTGCEPPA